MARNMLGDEKTEPTHVVYIAWTCNGENFAMSIRRGCQREALRTLGRWASDPSIAMGWSEAANVSKAIREAF